MTMMLIVGGIVLGLVVALAFLRKWNKGEKLAKWKGILLICPKCSVAFDAGENFRRSGLRGTFMTCPHCGDVSIWDMNMAPPKLKG